MMDSQNKKFPSRTAIASPRGPHSKAASQRPKTGGFALAPQTNAEHIQERHQHRRGRRTGEENQWKGPGPTSLSYTRAVVVSADVNSSTDHGGGKRRALSIPLILLRLPQKRPLSTAFSRTCSIRAIRDGEETLLVLG